MKTFFTTIILSTFITSHAQTATQTVNNFLRALEAFDYDKAYEILDSRDQNYKTYEAYLNEMPNTYVVEAIREIDSSFFTYSIESEKPTEEGMLFKIKTITSFNRTPVTLYRGFPTKKTLEKGIKESGKTVVEFLKDQKFDRFIRPKSFSILLTNNTIYLGWKAYEDELEQEAAHKKLISKINRIRNQHFATGTQCISYEEGIQKLEALQKELGDSEVLKDNINMYKSQWKDIQNVSFELDHTDASKKNKVKIKITNNHGFWALSSLRLYFKFLNADGEVLFESPGGVAQDVFGGNASLSDPDYKPLPTGETTHVFTLFAQEGTIESLTKVVETQFEVCQMRFLED